jgi:hypothetical protein
MNRMAWIALALACAAGMDAAFAQSMPRGDSPVSIAGEAAQTVAQAPTTPSAPAAPAAGGAASGASTARAAAAAAGNGTAIVMMGVAAAAIAAVTDGADAPVTHVSR